MSKRKKVGCVILNYNDAATTEKLVRRIFGYQSLDAVVVVDNGSTDGSKERLKELARELDPGQERVLVLETGRNGGYGAGNNAGVFYSCRELGVDHVLVANPDVVFSEKTIVRLSRLLTRHTKLGAVSARMQDPVYGPQPNGWPLLGLWGDLARSGPVCRRLFKPFLEYGRTYLKAEQAVYVDAVHGSMVMVDGKKFMECGGYDEKVFLYNEEAILGRRLQRKGYRTALLLSEQYLHQHSQSISKTYGDMWQRQKLRNKSALYYYKRYLKIGKLQELAVRAFFQVVRLEIWCGGVWKAGAESCRAMCRLPGRIRLCRRVWRKR